MAGNPEQASREAPVCDRAGVGDPSAEDGGDVKALLNLYERMVQGVGLADVLAHAATVVSEAVDAERATIYLLREESAELESIAVIGNVARRIRVPLSPESLAGYCGSTGQPVLIRDAYEDLSSIDPALRFDATWDRVNDFRTRDVMCVAATFKDRVLGVVQAINRRHGRFAAPDLHRLQEVARLVGFELFHARLYDELATLKQLDREKAQFMRVLVHELKSPVAGSKMLIDGLRFASREQPRTVAVLDRIGDRMDQLLNMISDVLELSRVKAALPLGQIEVIDLVPETRSGCEPYAEQAHAKGLALTVDLPEMGVPARFDRTGYQLVLSNLLSNAVKYTPKGQVQVKLVREPDRVALSLSDSGMGIPAHELPRLFTEFFRAENARKSNIHGTGVGLAAVKQMVERFGGVLEVQSQEGVGSTFTIRLPHPR